MHHVVQRRSIAHRHEAGRFSVQNRGRIGRIPRERIAGPASAVSLTVPVEPVQGPGADTGLHAFGRPERPWPVRLAARAGWAVWDRLPAGLRAATAAASLPARKAVAMAAAPVVRAAASASRALLGAGRQASRALLLAARRSARFLAAAVGRAVRLHALGLRVLGRAGSATLRAARHAVRACAAGLLFAGALALRVAARIMAVVLRAVLVAARLSALAAGQAVRHARRAGAGMRALLIASVTGLARGTAAVSCAAGRTAVRAASLLWRCAILVVRAALRALRALVLLPWKALLLLLKGVAAVLLSAGRGAARTAALLLSGARRVLRVALVAARVVVLLPWRILRLIAKAIAAAARAGFRAVRAVFRALLRGMALAGRLLVRVVLLPFQGIALLARALVALLRLSGRAAAAFGRLLLTPLRAAAALIRMAGRAARSAGDAVGPLLAPPAPQPVPAPQAGPGPSFAPAAMRSPVFAPMPAGEARRAAAEEWLVSQMTGFGGGSLPELTLLPRGALVAEAPLVEPRRRRRSPRLRGIASTLAFACATTLPTIALVAVVLHSRGPAEALPAPELAQMAPAVQPPAPVEAQPAQAPAMPPQPAPLQVGSAIGGKASVLAADIFAVDGRNLRLAATAAPPVDEVCEGPQGPWPCGQAAALEVSRRISGQDIVCRVVELNDGRGLPAASCRLNDRDIGGWLIRNGLALAYGPTAARYRTEEEQAQQERRGLWQGRFVVPWDWATQGAAGRVVGSLPPPPPPAEPGPAAPGQNRQAVSEAQRPQGPRPEAPRPRCPEKPTVRYLNIEPVKPAGC